MNDESTQSESHFKPRTMRVDAYGNTVAELEMDALDQAREFFGSETRLRISPTYSVIRPMVICGAHPRANGRQWYAEVTVEAGDEDHR